MGDEVELHGQINRVVCIVDGYVNTQWNNYLSQGELGTSRLPYCTAFFALLRLMCKSRMCEYFHISLLNKEMCK